MEHTPRPNRFIPSTHRDDLIDALIDVHVRLRPYGVIRRITVSGMTEEQLDLEIEDLSRMLLVKMTAPFLASPAPVADSFDAHASASSGRHIAERSG